MVWFRLPRDGNSLVCRLAVDSDALYEDKVRHHFARKLNLTIQVYEGYYVNTLKKWISRNESFDPRETFEDFNRDVLVLPESLLIVLVLVSRVGGRSISMLSSLLQMLVHLNVNKTNFHMRGFALGLALKQRRNRLLFVLHSIFFIPGVVDAAGPAHRWKTKKELEEWNKSSSINTKPSDQCRKWSTEYPLNVCARITLGSMS